MCIQKSTLLALLFILLNINSIYSQSLNSVSGKVLDKDNLPLGSTTILLLNKVDSAYITGMLTDVEGKFRFENVKQEECLLVVSMLGYKKEYLDIIQKDTMVKDIILEEDSHQLSDVTVTGKQNMISMEAGKTTINLNSSILGAQGSLLDVLRTLPGVFVKEDGTIMLNGQDGATILLNGKKTYLTGDALVSLLRSTPATSVGKIELITNPTAQYDAAGRSGLINIQTQKVNLEGIDLSLNGNFQYGKYGRGDIGGRFTYRKNKLSLHATYNHHNGTQQLRNVMIRDYINNDRKIQTDTRRKQVSDFDYLNIGFDYDITDKISIGGYTDGYIAHQTVHGDVQSAFNQTNQPTDSTLFTLNRNVNKRKNLQGEINIGYKDDKKREADLSFNYLLFRHDEDLTAKNRMFASDNLTRKDTLAGDLNGDINMFSLQANTAFPVLGKALLRTGAKATWVDIKNKALYTDRINNSWIANGGLSNQYNYNENINAAYIQMDAQTGAFSINAGLRLEHTRIEGEYFPSDPVKADSAYKTNYTHLFPSLTLQYNIPGTENSLALMYNRRIIRPNYRDLSPFNYIWDDYSISEGNPHLKPELTDILGISYVHRKLYRASLFFSYTDNAIMQSVYTLENNKLLIIPENVASNSRMGIRLDGADMTRLPWWRCSINATLYYSWQHWYDLGQKIKQEQFTPTFSLNNQFSFPKGWSAELTGFYNGKMAAGQFLIDPIWSVSAGVQKKFLNDNATVRLFANDIFSTYRTNMSASIRGLQGTGRERNDMTVIGISFTFNLKRGEQSKKSPRNSTIDESKRINL